MSVLLESRTLTSASRIWHQIMLKILPLAITQVEPAFRNEAVRIWEDLGIDVREDGCHANNCLQVIRYAVQIKSEPSAGLGTGGKTWRERLTPAGISQSL